MMKWAPPTCIYNINISWFAIKKKKNLANINVDVGFKQAHFVLFGEFSLVSVSEFLLISQNQLTGKKIHKI